MTDATTPTVLVAGLRLHGRPVLLVGGGNVATAKAERLLDAGAQLAVVTRTATQELRHWAQQGRLTLHLRDFADADCDGRFFVLSATGTDTDQQVFAACEARYTLCNAADVPEACSVWLMAQQQCGSLTLAIGTLGTAPGLAGRLSREALAGLPPDIDVLLQRYSDLRRWLVRDHAPGQSALWARTATLRWLAGRRWRFFALPTERQRQVLAARHALGFEAEPR
jgi:siroheme synthase-like protein